MGSVRSATKVSGARRGGSGALIVALAALVVLLPISLSALAWSSRAPGVVVALLAVGFAALHGASLLAVRRPVVAFAIASTVMLALVAFPASRDVSAAMYPSTLAYLLCLAQVAVQRRFRVSVAALAVGVAGAGLIAVAEQAFGTPGGGIDPVMLRLGAFAGLAAAVTAAWACGLLVRSAAVQAEERTRMRVGQAIVEERMRISGELHDVVAHAMTVMIAQSEVARAVMREDPATGERALGVVVSTGREALRGMRSIVAEEGSAPNEPIPTPDALPALVESVRSPACEAVFAEDGERRPLSAAAMLALHRAVREGLTNAVRHAGPPVGIAVTVTWTAERVIAEISDDGGSGTGDSGLGAGTGLVGLAERIRLAGGGFRAGPDGSGGWMLRAELPVRGDAA